MIEYLLLDLDDTILDFHKAERIALSHTMRSLGLEPSEEVLALYHRINIRHWEQLELGALTREQVLVGRFAALLRELGQAADPAECNERYEQALSQGHYFLPGAQEALESLRGKYRMFLLSNGTARVQHGRLASAGLYPFFEACFVSEEIGYNKPDRRYFEGCFARIPDFCRERALMVGDSLTSDIQGGVNAGVKTVWVNPMGKPWGAVRPDYVIKGLRELPALLEVLERGAPCGV